MKRKPVVTKLFTWKFTFYFWHILFKMTAWLTPTVLPSCEDNYFWQQSCFASQEWEMDGLWGNPEDYS